MTPGKPRTVKEILENFMFSNLMRTTRQKGNHYYRSTVDRRYSVMVKKDIILTTDKPAVEFRFEDSTTTFRQETVAYYFRENKVIKTFKENGFFLPNLRNLEFDIYESEEEYFQQGLMNSSPFFPDFKDLQYCKSITEDLEKDVFQWQTDVDQRANERAKQSIVEYRKKFKREPYWFHK